MLDDRGNDGDGASPVRSQPAECSSHGVHVYTQDIEYCRIAVQEQSNDVHNDHGMRVLARALSGHSLQSARAPECMCTPT